MIDFISWVINQLTLIVLLLWGVGLKLCNQLISYRSDGFREPSKLSKDKEQKKIMETYKDVSSLSLNLLKSFHKQSGVKAP